MRPVRRSPRHRSGHRVSRRGHPAARDTAAAARHPEKARRVNARYSACAGLPKMARQFAKLERFAAWFACAAADDCRVIDTQPIWLLRDCTTLQSVTRAAVASTSRCDHFCWGDTLAQGRWGRRGKEACSSLSSSRRVSSIRCGRPGWRRSPPCACTPEPALGIRSRFSLDTPATTSTEGCYRCSKFHECSVKSETKPEPDANA
jgi:hypothetical protein